MVGRALCKWRSGRSLKCARRQSYSGHTSSRDRDYVSCSGRTSLEFMGRNAPEMFVCPSLKHFTRRRTTRRELSHFQRSKEWIFSSEQRWLQFITNCVTSVIQPGWFRGSYSCRATIEWDTDTGRRNRMERKANCGEKFFIVGKDLNRWEMIEGNYCFFLSTSECSCQTTSRPSFSVNHRDMFA